MFLTSYLKEKIFELCKYNIVVTAKYQDLITK